MDDKKEYSIMIVSPGSSGARHLNVPKWMVSTFFALIALGFIILATGIYLTYNTSFQTSQYKVLKQTTTEQQEALDQAHAQLDELKSQLGDIIEKEEEIRILLGDTRMPSFRSFKRAYQKRKRESQAFKSVYDEMKKSLENDAVPTEGKIKIKSTFLHDVAKDIHNNLTKSFEKTQQYKARFAYTPSIRPLYGRILSRYGWRRHPITRKRRLHKGIDIAAWSGAPIQATADGLVEYAGWSGSFGYVVVIDHNFGYRTVYAHCSQLLTTKGELVKKGQIIAQVGTTGLSTGPHLHYEVRKWRNAADPRRYLDLDMYTASTRIW